MNIDADSKAWAPPGQRPMKRAFFLLVLIEFLKALVSTWINKTHSATALVRFLELDGSRLVRSRERLRQT
jgi:hypothetical protein